MSDLLETYRKNLCCGAAVAALLCSLPTYAKETETTETVEEEDLAEVVVVTGYKSAARDAIGAKRKATGILDAISSDQVGLLPDLTISDVARRIPGVTTISQAGPAGVRSVNSEQNVVIRGLDPSFNLTTFDGVPIASTSEDERAANLSIIPPTMISRIEAMKTITADLNPHALSGQLNLVTSSAFDRSGTFTSTRFSIGGDSTSGQGLEEGAPQLRASSVFSTQFGEDNQFGVVVSGSYETFNSSSYDFRPGAASSTYLFYEADPTSNSTVNYIDESNGYPAARRNQRYLFDTSKVRASGVLKLEYAPDASTYASLFGGLFYQDEEETRHEHLEAGNNRIRPTDQSMLVGTYTEAQVQQGYVYQPEESLTKVITGHYEKSFEGGGELDVTASYSRADVDIIRNMSKFVPAAGYSEDASYTYDLSSGQPVAEFANPAIVNDTTLYSNAYIRQRSQDIEQSLTFLSAKYSSNFTKSDMGFGYEIGVNYTGRDQVFDRSYIEGDVFNTVGCTEADITDCPLVTLDQYVLGQSLSGVDPNINFYFIDDASLRADWIAQGQTITNDRSDNGIRDDYELAENLYAAFAQLSYNMDRLNLRLGLRYDYTESTVDLFARDDRLDDDPDDAAQYVAVSRSSDYGFWLPSLNASYDVSDDVVVRGAYGRTIGRPNFSQLALQERINEPNFDDPADPSAGGTISITRGNPDLKPLVADNFDLSIEYYFDEGNSFVTVAGFYKDISDLIFTQTTLDTNFEFEGNILEATISQPVNATDSTIYGLELNVRKDFANILPAPFDGLAIEANATFIDSDFTFITSDGLERSPGGWENQPEFLGNIQLSYEKGPIGAKIAYNYVDSFLSNILSDTGDIYDMYREPRGVIDLQVRYNITDSLRVVGEVQNLTEAGVEYTREFPNDLTVLAADAERGRVIWIGFSWTPNFN